ncbi:MULTISPECIES: hypothetical protein [Arthrobacter]|uniref:Uncharacterized protein n=2 Tax=Arthrobacter TaxID=1663 RepID=A0ABU9KGB5_9MICC|nr:hypothetical protein [Arthrobacter sp. YJM1]MDP5225822.1 hypothetical protein [Arthrobacter sp. YJM1]
MPSTTPSEPLALSGVLASALPSELGTARAPSRYTVPAVFTRRPETREIYLLRGDDVRQRLNNAGYPAVELQVSDRRLLITNTNLDELKRGLALVIGDILAQISAEVLQEWTTRAERLTSQAHEEELRLNEVKAAAAEIVFNSSAWSQL